MENVVSLETNGESSEDIPIVRNIPVEWEHFKETHAYLNAEKQSLEEREELEEISDDSEEEMELAVDAIHPRLSSTVYFCVKCKKRFDSKKELHSHFGRGCYAICEKCGKKVYEKKSGGRFVQKCRKGCLPVLPKE